LEIRDFADEQPSEPDPEVHHPVQRLMWDENWARIR
jgi:hypothetical protein